MIDVTPAQVKEAMHNNAAHTILTDECPNCGTMRKYVLGRGLVYQGEEKVYYDAGCRCGPYTDRTEVTFGHISRWINGAPTAEEKTDRAEKVGIPLKN